METMHDWIQKLKSSEKLIIVEGIKDKKALESFEIKSVAIRKPLYKFIESIKEKEIIILTDLDSEGRKLYSKLKHEFQKRGKIIDNKFREFLYKNTRLTQIEGLTHYIMEKK